MSGLSRQSRKEPAMAAQVTIPVTISAIGLACGYGDHHASLLAGIGTKASCSRKFPYPLSSGPETEQQPRWAPVDRYPLDFGATMRRDWLQTDALRQLCEDLLPTSSEKLLVVDLQPDPTISFAARENEKDIADNIRNVHPALSQATIRFAPVRDGAVAALQQTIAELRQGLWDMVLFGGADSLIDVNCVTNLAVDNHCCSNRHADRLLPGEGAAYLLLSITSADDTAPVAIHGLGHTIEPNSGLADSRRTAELAQAIDQALAPCPLAFDQLDAIVVDHLPDQNGTLEWYQTTSRLSSGETPLTEHTEEWSPQLFLGHLGAASLPLALVLGYARFAFNFPPVSAVLVCEATPGNHRGAVVLKNNSTNQQQTDTRPTGS